MPTTVAFSRIGWSEAPYIHPLESSCVLQNLTSLFATYWVLTLLLSGLGAGCATPDSIESAGAQEPASQSWVTVYDPSRSWNGYTLAFYAHRVPILLDMNGRIVHRWPEARVKSRLRLLEDGSLLGHRTGTRRRGVRLGRQSGLGRMRPSMAFAHHDVIRLEKRQHDDPDQARRGSLR